MESSEDLEELITARAKDGSEGDSSSLRGSSHHGHDELRLSEQELMDGSRASFFG